MSNSLRILVAFTSCFAISGALCAEQSEDEAAVRKAAESYVKAFNDRDAKSLARHWSPDAVYQNSISGEEVVGRVAIEKQFAAILAELSDAKLEVTIDTVQFVSPNVAIERGTSRFVQPDAEPQIASYTAVHVKRDGKWLLDRSTEEEVPVVLTNYERLKDLEWMIGTWVDEDDQARVETTCQWTKNQNFITRFFAVSIADRIDMSGMQIIGWDPKTGDIRSWVFDSDGGFGEATWTKRDKRWVINAAATLPDGRMISAVNVLTMVDADTFMWQSTGRELDGEILPNIAPIKVVRGESADGE